LSCNLSGSAGGACGEALLQTSKKTGVSRDRREPAGLHYWPSPFSV